MKKFDFSEETKRKCLLWCARHCCLCGKDCGVDIEIAHIEREKNDLENAIPLCYDCHSKIGHYNHEHPRGNRYKAEELVPRRNQIYDQYTQHLVPIVIAKIMQDRELPGVGFQISTLGSFPPVKAKVTLTVFLGVRDLGKIKNQHRYYDGETTWHLNPGIEFHGNFTVPVECIDSKDTVRIQIDVRVIDMYDREHSLLPFCYTYLREDRLWFLEPTSFENLRLHLD
jgi:hypothetical protein